MKSAFLITIIISIFLYTPFFQSYCMKEGAEETLTLEDKSQIPEYILQNVVHFHYEKGILKVKVVFEKGEYYSNQGELRVENCNFVYYDIDSSVVSRGSSKRARLYDDGSKLIAEDNVIVISEENKGKLETEYLEWHGNENQFTTDRYVKITQENGDTISGVGMIADIGLKRVTIKKDVKGSFKKE